MKALVEQCSSIVCSTLQKETRRLIDRDYPDSSEEELFAKTKEELEKFSINGQKFLYTSTPNALGGHRWFFICEKCQKRVSKLFLPPENYAEYEKKYLCKECHGLQNESVMKANNSIYKRVIRPLKRLRDIETKLEKGHLTQEKVQELLNKYDEIEAGMKDSPEYRLYTFKKKRGMKLI